MFGASADILDGLEHEIESLTSRDPAVLSDDAMGEVLVGLGRLRARLAAAEAHLTAAWDARQGWSADGARAGGAWLAHRTRRPVAQCRRQVRSARSIGSMPLVDTAYTAGDLNEAHVQALGRVRTVERAALFERDEAVLVEHATRLDFCDFERVLRHWVLLADDELGLGEPDIEARRRFSINQTIDGWWRADGMLPPLAGTAVKQALGDIADELHAADVTDAKDAGIDEPGPGDLARTRQQRNADALAEMAFRAAATPPGSRRPRPLVTVLVGDDRFRDTCELANGTVLAPSSVARHITDADIERVVFGPRSRVLDVGHTQRLFTGATRRAVEVRDRRCTWPGCHTPVDRCQVDHLHPHARGGATTQANGALLCGFHNRRKETGAFTVTRQPDGSLLHRRPDGHQIE